MLEIACRDTIAPTYRPTKYPSSKPTITPTDKPTLAPTPEPTQPPTNINQHTGYQEPTKRLTHFVGIRVVCR